MALTKIDDRGLKTPIDLLDSEKIRFGTGNDLEIYHNGSHSYIDNTNGTGNIYIQDEIVRVRAATSFAVDNADGTETALMATLNGAIKLYYDNSKKLETVSDGIDVAGSVDINSGGNLYLEDNGKIRLGNSEDLQIYHSGTQNFIDSVNNTNVILRAGTGTLYLQGSDVLLGDEGATEKYIDCHKDGAVELYYDNVKKFETGSTVNVNYANIEITDGYQLRFDNGFNNRSAEIYNAGSSGNSTLQFKTNGTERALIASNGDVKITSRGSGDSGAPFYVAVTGKSTSTYVGGADDTACVRIVDNGSTDSYYHGIELRSKNGGDSRIYSHDRGSGDKADLVFALDNSGINERIRFRAERGICFNGDTADANAIDDYEEGTWTPSATSGTFTTATGTYTKVGRLVTCIYVIEVHTSTSGNYMQINGLPFTNSGSSAGSNGSAVSYTNGSYGNGIFGYVTGSGSAILFTNNAATLYTYANCSTDHIRGSVTYYTS